MKKSKLLFFICIILIPNRAYSQWILELKSNLEIINKIETTRYNNRGYVSSKKSISWYDKGKIKKKEMYENGEMIRAFLFSYVEEKRKQEIRKTVSPVNIIMYTINTYDKKGNLKKSKSYSSKIKDSYHVQSNFKYDEFGRVVSLKVTSVNGRYKSQSDFLVTYPDETTVKRETIKDGRKEFDWTISYDWETNTVISETVQFEGADENTSSKHKLVKPTEIGWLVKDTINQSDNMQILNKRITKFKYYYDDKGNWTEMYEVKKDGTEQLREKRKIDYEHK